MDETVIRTNRERVFAFFLGMAGLYAFLLSLRHFQWLNMPLQAYLLAFLFSAFMIFADRYPIHLLRGTKLSLINLPIFLSTTLLSAPLAIAATAVGLLTANFLGKVERGLLPRDIIFTVGQWMLTVYLGYQIVHLDRLGLQAHQTRLELLLFCAFSFLLLDFVIFSISQALIYGEPFLATLKAVVKEGFVLEASQYLIAIPGILAADTDLGSLILLIVPISMTYHGFKNIKETRFETVQILNDMADTVDLRDTYTGGHSKHVADLAHRTLVQLKIAGPEATLIEIAARLHDIGKIGMPDSILLKPGRLLPEEMAIMQTHSRKGAELISKYKDFARGAEMILHHHERWDGQGYPAGLKGHAIPFGARIIAVADSFEAMTSDRPYRTALSTNQAIQILLEGRGKQWDPQIVNSFVDMVISQMDEKAAKNPPELELTAASSPTLLTSSQTPLGM
jgi:HD-GYP domain-containing protein (c-di-GMP phosphodiesterase class II)